MRNHTEIDQDPIVPIVIHIEYTFLDEGEDETIRASAIRIIHITQPRTGVFLIAILLDMQVKMEQ